MRADELEALTDGLNTQSAQLRKRVNQMLRESGHPMDVLTVHVSSLRAVPQRLEKAIAMYAKRGVWPRRLKLQDAIALHWRVKAAISVLGFISARRRAVKGWLPASGIGQNVQDKITKADAQAHCLGLDISKLGGNRQSVLRYLLFDTWTDVPDSFFDAVAEIALAYLNKKSGAAQIKNVFFVRSLEEMVRPLN